MRSTSSRSAPAIATVMPRFSRSASGSAVISTSIPLKGVGWPKKPKRVASRFGRLAAAASQDLVAQVVLQSRWPDARQAPFLVAAEQELARRPGGRSAAARSAASPCGRRSVPASARGSRTGSAAALPACTARATGCGPSGRDAGRSPASRAASSRRSRPAAPPSGRRSGRRRAASSGGNGRCRCRGPPGTPPSAAAGRDRPRTAVLRHAGEEKTYSSSPCGSTVSIGRVAA